MPQRGRRVLILHTLMRCCWQSEAIDRRLFAVAGWAVGGWGFRALAFVFVQPAFECFHGGREVEPHRPQQVDGVEIGAAVEAVPNRIAVASVAELAL